MALDRMGQLISSAGTSLNQAAATFRKVEFRAGSLNLDYGGGRYGKGTELLERMGVGNALWDPFNRTETENFRARLKVARSGGADTVTCNNVLNVIDSDEALRAALAQCALALKEGGKAYFLVHEGDRSGVGRQTKAGYQRNCKAQAYEGMIGEFFGALRRRGNLIEAAEPRPEALAGVESLFGLEALERDLAKACGKAGVPRRAKGGAGKLIGGCLYLHRDHEGLLDAEALAKAKGSLPEGFAYAVVKADPKEGAFSFIASPDFDEADEPKVGDAWRIARDGKATLTRGKADPQIYHHKWNFVSGDTRRFDPLESMIRSLEWFGLPGLEKSRIGTLSYWEREALPRLGAAAKSAESAEPAKGVKPRRAKS